MAPLSAREAFRVANADFHVAGRPVFDADMQPIPGYQAITRMDTGRVGGGWRVSSLLRLLL